LLHSLIFSANRKKKKKNVGNDPAMHTKLRGHELLVEF